MTKMLT